jgi:hypothetical protein
MNIQLPEGNDEVFVLGTNRRVKIRKIFTMVGSKHHFLPGSVARSYHRIAM